MERIGSKKKRGLNTEKRKKWVAQTKVLINAKDAGIVNECSEK